MPRRHALTAAQLEELFALPTERNTLVRYWTLTAADLEEIHRRRRDRNGLVVTFVPKVTLRKPFYFNVLSVYANCKPLKSRQTQLLQTLGS
jgi:hypothetical protein